MFNAAFALGGQNGSVTDAAACTQKTVEAATGVYIHHFVVIDMAGFVTMVDALGGIPMDIPQPIRSRKARLDLDAGHQVLDGRTALGYARARTGEGLDGSDLGRIERQQMLLGATAQEVLRKNLLTDVPELLAFLNAAARSLTVSSKIAAIPDMAGLALSLQGISSENINFLTVPVAAAPSDPNRVVWTSEADDLWQALRDDVPLDDRRGGDRAGDHHRRVGERIGSRPGHHRRLMPERPPRFEPSGPRRGPGGDGRPPIVVGRPEGKATPPRRPAHDPGRGTPPAAVPPRPPTHGPARGAGTGQRNQPPAIPPRGAARSAPAPGQAPPGRPPVLPPARVTAPHRRPGHAVGGAGDASSSSWSSRRCSRGPSASPCGPTVASTAWTRSATPPGRPAPPTSSPGRTRATARSSPTRPRAHAPTRSCCSTSRRRAPRPS